eukprot:1714108-Pleurochrysis_carterae.AAC.1
MRDCLRKSARCNLRASLGTRARKIAHGAMCAQQCGREGSTGGRVALLSIEQLSPPEPEPSSMSVQKTEKVEGHNSRTGERTSLSKPKFLVILGVPQLVRVKSESQNTE